MRIELQSKQSAVGGPLPAGASRREAGDSFTRMLAGIAILSVAATGLYGALSPAYRALRSTREELRASQIVMKKAETLCLLDRNQVCETNHQGKPLFVEPYSARHAPRTPGGVQYTGYLSTGAPTAAGQPANTSRGHLRSVTVTLCWTNAEDAKPTVHRREIQARLAPNGMPKYVWGTL
jgi:hypothetical protein